MGTVYAKEGIDIGIPKKEMNYDICDGTETKEVDLDCVQARVDRVHIEGLVRTKNDIIEDVVKDLFSAQDFQQVLIKVHKVRTKLDSLGCFRSISIFIDTSKGPKATKNGLEVTYNVQELRRIVGGASSHVGNNEGSLVIGLRAPNMFGRGERFQAEYTHGSKGSSNFNVAYVHPFRGKHNPLLTASVYQAMAEWPSSGYKELDRGVLLDVGFNSFAQVKHNVQWIGEIRDLGVLNRGSSFEVREESGATLKSALRHILSVDDRDDVIFPSCGTLLQLNSEVAGLGGDVGFLKNDFYLQLNTEMANGFVLQCTGAGGVIKSISNNLKMGLSDTFYLGGPLSLRGFSMRGVGPHADENALGSLCFWSGGVHIYTPLPFRPGKGGFGELFRTHLFVNAGNLANFEEEDGFARLKKNIRIAYGIGVAIRLGQMARVEVNYCFPHAFDGSDKTHPGVQFGIGVQFV